MERLSKRKIREILRLKYEVWLGRQDLMMARMAVLVTDMRTVEIPPGPRFLWPSCKSTKQDSTPNSRLISATTGPKAWGDTGGQMTNFFKARARYYYYPLMVTFVNTAIQTFMTGSFSRASSPTMLRSGGLAKRPITAHDGCRYHHSCDLNGLSNTQYFTILESGHALAHTQVIAILVSSAPSGRTNGEKGWLWPRKLPISGIGIEDLQYGRYPCHTTRHAGPHRAARGFEVRTVSAPQSVKVRKGQDAVEQHAAVAPPAMTIARHLPGDIFAGPSALISR